jgi:hypothetical protein
LKETLLSNKNDEPLILLTIEIETDPKETWVMTSGYGVSSAVYMGANIYEGNVAVLFVQGRRGGKSNALRMKTEALDQFCEAWLRERSEQVKSVS